MNVQDLVDVNIDVNGVDNNENLLDDDDLLEADDPKYKTHWVHPHALDSDLDPNLVSIDGGKAVLCREDYKVLKSVVWADDATLSATKRDQLIRRIVQLGNPGKRIARIRIRRQLRPVALPETMDKLEALTRFHSWSPTLASLPESIGNCQNLLSLWLCNAAIPSLPESIGNLTGLRYLDVSKCQQLKRLPESIGNLTQLESLFLTKSGLVALPESLQTLTSLYAFKADGCPDLPDAEVRKCALGMTRHKVRAALDPLGETLHKLWPHLLHQPNKVYRAPCGSSGDHRRATEPELLFTQALRWNPAAAIYELLREHRGRPWGPLGLLGGREARTTAGSDSNPSIATMPEELPPAPDQRPTHPVVPPAFAQAFRALWPPEGSHKDPSGEGMSENYGAPKAGARGPDRLGFVPVASVPPGRRQIVRRIVRARNPVLPGDSRTGSGGGAMATAAAAAATAGPPPRRILRARRPPPRPGATTPPPPGDSGV